MDRKLKIDYLFLDNTVCQRCVETEKVLDSALSTVKSVLESAGYTFLLNRVHIDSAQKSREWRFLSSPTIRVNNVDIAPSLSENDCGDCGELCGCGEETQCRTWEIGGVNHEIPLESFIVDRILHAVYASDNPTANEPYTLSDNLKNYFEGKAAKEEPVGESACCGPSCCG